MTEPRKENRSAAAPILVAVLAIAMPLGAYVAGYFCLGEVSRYSNARGDTVARGYRYEWLSDIYDPAAIIEQRLRGANTRVYTHYYDHSNL